MNKILSISALTTAAAVFLTGCSAGTASTGGGSLPGMNHGSPGMSASSAPAAADFNAADAMFAQMMIPHHAQAVEMSDLMLTKQGIPAAVTDLATRIKAAQGPEIEKMTGWLKGWDQPKAMSSVVDGGHSMSGMMGDDDMTRLGAAQGTEAARLFLTQMTAHHEGAVVMAKGESSDGKNPEAVQLAKGIVTAQEAEIQEMKSLLAAL